MTQHRTVYRLIECPALGFDRAKEYQARLTMEMHDGLESVDALICPATTGVPPDAATTGDPVFNSPWSFTGLPVVSFPATPSGGLPLGVQLVGGPFEERVLFQAAWCEDALAVRLGVPTACR